MILMPIASTNFKNIASLLIQKGLYLFHNIVIDVI